MSIELINEASFLINQYRKGGDTQSTRELQHIRRELATILFNMNMLSKELKFEWKSAEFQRKKTMASTESGLLDAIKGGKKLTRDDRRNQALMLCEDEYNVEIECESNYDKFRTAMEGIKQVLNSIASELKSE